jgi:GTP-binding protein
MFIDEAEIYVRAGNGGDGVVRFRRESRAPRGGPNGGDGGDGGNVILYAKAGLDTLLDVRSRHHWLAEDGEPGGSKDMGGADGEDLVIDVPPGTLIYDRDLGILLKDLDHPGAQVIIARGGKGGRGNGRFATATNQTPREAETGTPGESRHLKLELKLIADVGLIGLPNAGKSTLLARLSAAHPKIADYPFTTLEPNLGIVQAGAERRFVMADLPGLIEGAHKGVGLGDEFLRHVERTRILVHLVELEPHDRKSPAEAYKAIRDELVAYSPDLAAKPELVVLTKIDILPGDDSAREEFARAIGRPVLAISSATGAGLKTLVKAILDILDEIDARAADDAKAAIPTAPPPHVLAAQAADAAPPMNTGELTPSARAKTAAKPKVVAKVLALVDGDADVHADAPKVTPRRTKLLSKRGARAKSAKGGKSTKGTKGAVRGRKAAAGKSTSDGPLQRRSRRAPARKKRK